MMLGTELPHQERWVRTPRSLGRGVSAAGVLAPASPAQVRDALCHQVFSRQSEPRSSVLGSGPPRCTWLRGDAVWPHGYERCDYRNTPEPTANTRAHRSLAAGAAGDDKATPALSAAVGHLCLLGSVSQVQYGAPGLVVYQSLPVKQLWAVASTWLPLRSA